VMEYMLQNFLGCGNFNGIVKILESVPASTKAP